MHSQPGQITPARNGSLNDTSMAEHQREEHTITLPVKRKFSESAALATGGSRNASPGSFLEWAFLGDPEDIDGCECLESSERVSPKTKAESPDYTSLKTKTDILIPVIAATAAGEILAFGIAGLTLASLGQRLNRAETILQVYSNINPIQFNCGVC